LCIAAAVHHLKVMRDSKLGSNDPASGGEYVLFFNDKQFQVSVISEENKVFGVTLSSNEEAITVDLKAYLADDFVIPAKIGEKEIIAQLFKKTDLGYEFQLNGSVFSVDVLNPLEADFRQFMKATTVLHNVNAITSPMAGTLVSIAVKPGDRVVVGQEIAVVEAMKMQNVLRSSRDGVVQEVKLGAGKPVQLDESIVELAPLAVDQNNTTAGTAVKSK